MCNPIYRALVVSPTPTWPLDFGNRKRIFSVCKNLKAIGFEVHFVHYASESDWRSNLPMDSRIKMDLQWDFVDHVFPSVELHAWPKSAADHMIDEWWDPVLENHLKSVFTSRVYDLVLVNYTWLSKALEFVPAGILKVLDTHDKFSGRRQLLEANGIEKEYYHTTEIEECKGLSRADLVWAIKKEEEREFSKMDIQAALDTLVHLDDLRISKSPYTNQDNSFLTFGFIGARNNINKTNIQNFLEVAIPIFEKYLPPLELLIAGSVCKDLVLKDNSFVRLVGYVETTDYFYDAIDVAVIPMEFSTGLKIKAGEALSQGKALISHKHAMEGYPATHPLHSCCSFEEVAIAMCELAYEPEMVVDLAAATCVSNERCNSEISNVFTKLKRRIARRTSVVCFLPEQFGDERKSLIHWFVYAQMEWLGWRVCPVFLSLHKKHYEFSDTRVRYVTEEQAVEMLLANGNTTIYNLDEKLPQSIRSLSATIFEYFCNAEGSNCVKQSFLGGNNSVLVPGFGGRKIPWLSQLQEVGNVRKGVAVIIGDNPLIGLKELLSCLKLDSTEEVVEFQLSSFYELELTVNEYIDRNNSTPRIVVVGKANDTLNYAEQLLIDMCVSHGIRVIFSNDIFDFTFDMDAPICAELKSEIYSNYFFPHWEKAEGLIRNSINKRSTLVQPVETAQSLVSN